MGNLAKLPVEIQEIILSLLSLDDLLSMSKVCRLWFGICSWVAKKKFSKIIPLECVEEIRNLGVTQDETWLTAINYHYLQNFLTNKLLEQTKNDVIELDENRHFCFCIYGPFTLIGCDSGEIELYNPQESNKPVFQIKLKDSPIFQLEKMPSMKLLVAKTGSSSLAFVSLPCFTDESKLTYQMTYLKPNVQNYTGEFHSKANFSITGATLVIVTDAQLICVFQIISVTKSTVELRCIASYGTHEAIAYVSAWEDEVIVLLKAGEILRWCLSKQTIFITDRYSEIRYENPVWIFRGRIFCSTTISSQLLGYWRMNRGTEYWLLGKPERDLVRCRDLGIVSTGTDAVAEDVLCVCLKQRLLACGTRSGKVLLYYLSDTFFSCDDFMANGNHQLTREFNRIPDLTMLASDSPLANIQMEFEENSIAIYAWPYMVKNKPQLGRLLHSILLKKSER